MNLKFKILTYTNDPEFSALLALECDKYNFSLSFIENIESIKSRIKDRETVVIILDLNDKKIDTLSLGSKIKHRYELPMFGVLNTFKKTAHKDAKEKGFDLVFTKKMLIKSIKEVVTYVSNE